MSAGVQFKAAFVRGGFIPSDLTSVGKETHLDDLAVGIQRRSGQIDGLRIAVVGNGCVDGAKLNSGQLPGTGRGVHQNRLADHPVLTDAVGGHGIDQIKFRRRAWLPGETKGMKGETVGMIAPDKIIRIRGKSDD